jgi:catechol 2,3-dioxygenase-like lactoylglutathione lyase family enzyme
MLADKALVGFVATMDLERARRFYADVLGLRLVEQNEFAAVFDAAGTMLQVTLVHEPARAAYTVLGWQVPDIEQTVDALADRGVEFLRFDGMQQDTRGVWTTPDGSAVAWFRDPDGNTVSLTRFASTDPGRDR